MIVNEDSTTVRRAFRRLCQRGAILIGVVAVLYALLQYILDISQWPLALLPAPLCVPLHWMMSVRRPFWVFAIGLFVMSMLLVGLCASATLTFGRSSGFHLILTVILPIVVVSGRIGARTKWLFVVLLAVFLIGLDLVAVDTGALDGLSPYARASLRAITLAVPALCTTNLVLHYFHRVGKQQAALMHLATTDPLTGLHNRRQISALAQELMQEQRRGRRPFSVVLCDLDYFKAVNDSHGHEAGDRVLRDVGQELSRGLREFDSVGRWGGEEFLLLLPQTDLEGGCALADRLRGRLAARFDSADSSEPRVTATMGVSVFRDDDTLEKVIARADAALYAGKAAGRNVVMAESLP